MRFRATLELAGKTATGIEVRAEVVEALGSGRKPAVRVTIRGHTFATSVASRGGRFLIPVSAERRAGAGIAAGDELDVDIELDTASREARVPEDLASALDAAPDAKRFFDGLTPTQRSYFAADVESAKKPETRRRRVAKAVEMLSEGRKR